MDGSKSNNNSTRKSFKLAADILVPIKEIRKKLKEKLKERDVPFLNFEELANTVGVSKNALRIRLNMPTSSR